MKIFRKAVHSKINIFVKFESEQKPGNKMKIKKNLDSFYLGHRDHMYAVSSKSGWESCKALGNLIWNDPIYITLCTCNNCADVDTCVFFS